MINIFALIDAANTPDLFAIVEKHNPLFSCLYNEPIQEGMREVAPYLIEATVPIKEWLASLTTPWGIYLLTEPEVAFIDLRRHLRRFTYAMIPVSEKPVFFRFYDPRVFWNLCDILDDWQLHDLLGPISIVASYYNGELKQGHFSERRKEHLSNTKKQSMYLTLNESQYSVFDLIYEEEYVKELSDHMCSFIDPSLLDKKNLDSEQFHREMLLYERDVRGVEIKHPEDLALIHEGEPLFMKSFNSLLWVRVASNSLITLDNVISQKLSEIGREKLGEMEFHKLTEGVYQDYFLSLIEREEKQLEEERNKRKKEEGPLTEEELRSQINQFARDFIKFGKEQDIIDDRSYKSLSELFIIRGFYNFNKLPKDWIYSLNKDDQSLGSERAFCLFIKILNEIETIETIALREE